MVFIKCSRNSERNAVLGTLSWSILSALKIPCSGRIKILFIVKGTITLSSLNDGYVLV